MESRRDIELELRAGVIIRPGDSSWFDDPLVFNSPEEADHYISGPYRRLLREHEQRLCGHLQCDICPLSNSECDEALSERLLKKAKQREIEK